MIMAWTSRLIAMACALLVACAGNPNATECATGITCPEGTKCAAVQPVCITNDCGDGIVQLTEVCDDGNIEDGDGCAANCLSREQCGDGVLNSAAGEVCDDGNTMAGDGCAADCRSIEICGNGVRDVNEACDDGNTVPGDGCSGNCKSTEVCGNGIVDINEKCDDGGAPGGCNDDCQGGTGCGDGAIDKDGSGNPLEECDDGNADNQDDCTNACKLNICGDGIVQTSGVRVEQCDPSVGFGETVTCNLDCTSASCGDGKINNAAGEQCDAGPGMNADNRDCTSLCKVNVCGDGLADTLGPAHLEECDDGNAGQTDGCSNQCTLPACGNGVREMGEACDDGNTTNGDGCSSTCAFESCGDGIVNNGEDCDPGPMFETASCNADCTNYVCGDLKVNRVAGEQCDDGNTMNTDACRNDCKLNVCGDGFKSPTELCDDGNANNADGCTTSCTTPSCGNGIVDMNEQCDDGNTNSLDGCLNTCVYNVCGDGFRNPALEQCDNGLGNGTTKDCLPTCKTNVCGDGFRDMEGSTPATTEACDDGNAADETACPYGIQSCTLCDATCDNVENLTGNVCGDGILDAANEACDDQNRVTETSCPYGTASCTSFCRADCQMLLSLTGPYCGDGTTQAAFGEACDDHNTSACGTCDASCNTITSAKATGYLVLVPANGLADGATVTISDGVGTIVTFELDDNSMATGTPISFNGSEDAAQMANKFKNAINGSALKIDAVANGALVTLAHKRKTALGNQTITDTITNPDFIVTGMSGGAGGDCASTIGCNTNDDCQSGTCKADKTCQ
jgi:cysteine-rich repeat protein